MRKRLLWALIAVAAILTAFILLGHHYMLNSAKLDAAIGTEIPPGSAKAQVVAFVQVRNPVAFDDMGPHVKARFSGRSENMVYRRDIVITFEFSGARLLSFSTKEYLSFLW